MYAASNWHVAVQGGFSVIRVNRTDGKAEIIELGPEDWEFDPQAGYDLAVAPIETEPGHRLKFSMTAAESFVTEEHFRTKEGGNLGVGDDVFMVGRFVDHDGGPTNQPAARFGHISIGPTNILGPFHKNVATICLDTNSRTGFSGSPIYVYRTNNSDLELLFQEAAHGRIMTYHRPMLMLLGVHIGQFREWWEYKEHGLADDADEGQMTAGQIRGLSGMTKVAPAWALHALLDIPKFKEEREYSDAVLVQQQSSGIGSVTTGQEATGEG
jgi:hypothetical protein